MTDGGGGYGETTTDGGGDGVMVAEVVVEFEEVHGGRREEGLGMGGCMGSMVRESGIRKERED